MIIDDLVVSHHPHAGRPTLDGVSLQVSAGECVAVVGPSGSGKSTLVKTALGLIPRKATVTATTLSVAGVDTRALRPRQWNRLRGNSVGLVLQDALVALDPLRTIGREIREPLITHRTVPRTQRAAEVSTLLDRVHLPHLRQRLHHYPHQLSGGERQRVLIASAIAARPRLLIADEPTTALDVTVQAEILDLLRELRDHGHGILLVSHDLSAVAELADRVAILHRGRIIEQGTTEQVLHRPHHPITRGLVDAGAHRPPVCAPVDRGAPSRPVLVLDRVGKTFDATNHPRGVIEASLSLHAGESIGLVGESGSGKSTLAHLALGFVTPDHGHVTVNGQPWSDITERQRRPHRHSIQLIDQDTLAAFDPRYTIRRILAEPLRAAHPRGDLSTTITGLLESVGLDAGITRLRPRDLSGGQRQRVALARALAARPDVLVCDEPVSALDPISQSAIVSLLDELRRTTGVALLFISHDLAVVRRLCDRTAVMRHGRIVESGVTEQLWSNAQHPYTQRLLRARPAALPRTLADARI
ncbi:ABC transporter ATP-binding protein [Rhodococcus rhodochrous]|nr:ABC transporter ATP-binding protein [Rhodococcus rhodochrous]